MPQSLPVPHLGGRRSEKGGGKARLEAPDGDGGGHRRAGGRGGGTTGLPSLATHPAASAERRGHFLAVRSRSSERESISEAATIEEANARVEEVSTE